MKQIQKDQAAFMQACGQELPKMASWLSSQNAKRRYELFKQLSMYKSLIHEEFYNELMPRLAKVLKTAQLESNNASFPLMNEEDLAGFLDDCIDIIYVVLGFANTLGLPMQEGWNECQRSNMAKVGKDGKVLKREDGKILKPDGWTPPDFLGIIQTKLEEAKTPKEPWQAKASQALVHINKLARDCHKFEAAIHSRNYVELTKLGYDISQENVAFANAITEGMDKDNHGTNRIS